MLPIALPRSRARSRAKSVAEAATAALCAGRQGFRRIEISETRDGRRLRVRPVSDRLRFPGFVLWHFYAVRAFRAVVCDPKRARKRLTSSPAAFLLRSGEHNRGEVSERFKEHAWKACVGETQPWVRIPPSPPSGHFSPNPFGVRNIELAPQNAPIRQSPTRPAISVRAR